MMNRTYMRSYVALLASMCFLALSASDRSQNAKAGIDVKTPRESKAERIEGRLRIDRAQLWVDSVKFGLNEDTIITINGRAAKANDLKSGDSVIVTLMAAAADKATVAGYASRVAAHRENAPARFHCWNAMGGCVCNYNGHGAFYGSACTDWELAGFD